uniref:Putative ovule protein n=1 Tax=Solanum chacoense TaxID=4108 RepID=A0A0V0I408_SOLCH
MYFLQHWYKMYINILSTPSLVGMYTMYAPNLIHICSILRLQIGFVNICHKLIIQVDETCHNANTCLTISI